MSEVTQLVRDVVVDRLAGELDKSVARSIATKVAGDPKLDRIDMSSKSIEPIAQIVAKSIYRINLADFGVSKPDRTRRDVVEGVTMGIAQRISVDLSEELLVRGRKESLISQETEVANHKSQPYTKNGDIIVAENDPRELSSTAFDDDKPDGGEDDNDHSDIIIAEGG